MYTNGDVAPTRMDASDFDSSKYWGISIWHTRKDRMPIVILRKKTPPYHYCVAHRMNTMFFLTFEEAEEFCTKRGYRKDSE